MIILFNFLIEASKNDNPLILNKNDGIIKLNEIFKDDPLRAKVSTMIYNSHDYKGTDLSPALTLARNYDWKETFCRVSDLQGIDKPVKEDKADSIADDLRQEGQNKNPLIAVNKLHGITPQSNKKHILLDGHHRKEAMKRADIKTTPIYKGTYTGNAEISHDDLFEKLLSSDQYTIGNQKQESKNN